jgi:hypothetical protein
VREWSACSRPVTLMFRLSVTAASAKKRHDTITVLDSLDFATTNPQHLEVQPCPGK